MGEVYRATDTNLDRHVAIKVLPQAFALDADRLARFEREAKTLASLNHPNIATIHGLEIKGEVLALVMELVEGPDLAERIAQGALPLTRRCLLPNRSPRRSNGHTSKVSSIEISNRPISN